MDESELAQLREAVRRLETVSLPIRVAHFLGKPVELAIERLPREAREAVGEATSKALNKALELAIWSMGPQGRWSSPRWVYKPAAAISGGAGGAFGWAALSVELPISTTIMLRSIADLARAEGEDLEQVEARLACLSVFALGGHSSADNAAETGYFATRAALANAIAAAGEHLLTRGAATRGPGLIALIQRIAARFKIAVSEKLLAQTLPVLGGVGGAAINLVFIDHFQDVASGHFTVRRLERRHGTQPVRDAYERLAAELRQQGDPADGQDDPEPDQAAQ
jgi:hypothetical protein